MPVTYEHERTKNHLREIQPVNSINIPECAATVAALGSVRFPQTNAELRPIYTAAMNNLKGAILISN